MFFSDETKVCCFGLDGQESTWKLQGEALKHGGGHVMIWGCMSWAGVGRLVKIDSIMDKELYISILDEDLQGSLEDVGLTLQDIIFQQDNDPKHTAKATTKWLEEHDVLVMKWPFQPPDLNPIEHVWVILKRRLISEYEEPPSGIIELWERIQEQWHQISVDDIRKLIESMPDRCEVVIQDKGGHTKY